MLLANSNNPKRDPYYLGALSLEFLSKQKEWRAHFLELYRYLKLSSDIEMGLFILVLDWLFILKTINYNESTISINVPQEINH